jgi:hypothetical protein
MHNIFAIKLFKRLLTKEKNIVIINNTKEIV